MALKSKPLEQVRTDLPFGEISRGAIVRVNINVTLSTRRTWKLAAINQGITVTELIERSVRDYLATQMSTWVEAHVSEGAPDYLSS